MILVKLASMTAPSESLASKIPVGSDIILYDGICGLCSHFVRFVAPRSPKFLFAPLQSSFAATALKRHGVTASECSAVYLIRGFQTSAESLLSRSCAILYVCRVIGWPWRTFTLMQALPVRVLDFFYAIVARWRYRIFGRSNACDLPQTRDRDRFLC